MIVSSGQRSGLTWLSGLHQLPRFPGQSCCARRFPGLHKHPSFSYTRLEHAKCKLLTVPCKRQSCPRSFGSSGRSGRDGSHVGKGWKPRGHGDPAVGCLQTIPCPQLLEVLGADPHTGRGQQGHLQHFGFVCVAPPEFLTSLCLPSALLQM